MWEGIGRVQENPAKIKSILKVSVDSVVSIFLYFRIHSTIYIVYYSILFDFKNVYVNNLFVNKSKKLNKLAL